MYFLIVKPFFDKLFALLGILILSPLYVSVMLLLWTFQRGKVFFVQDRIGFKRKVFRIIKFRTMEGEEGMPGSSQAAERLTSMGKLLRRTSLDELPQLWNVIAGEMSLIGPRPLPVEYLNLFSTEQDKRHDVRPGITGWTQVNGRHELSWTQKFELDLYYVNNLSFRLDLLILFKTVILLLAFKKDNSLSEKPFTGN